MDSTCRLCAVQSSALTSIFSLKCGRLIADMISIICPVKIEVTDTLPHGVCTKCLKIITNAIELREKSVESDMNFRSMDIQSIPESVVIKKEVDPFTSTIFFENETGTESSEENGEDDFFQVVNYEPEIKKRRVVKTCGECGRQFTTKSHLTKHMR